MQCLLCYITLISTLQSDPQPVSYKQSEDRVSLPDQITGETRVSYDQENDEVSSISI